MPDLNILLGLGKKFGNNLQTFCAHRAAELGFAGRRQLFSISLSPYHTLSLSLSLIPYLSFPIWPKNLFQSQNIYLFITLLIFRTQKMSVSFSLYLYLSLSLSQYSFLRLSFQIYLAGTNHSWKSEPTFSSHILIDLMQWKACCYLILQI